MITPLVTVEWLAENMNHPDLIILDASMGMVGKSESNNLDGYIPNSIFFDIKKRFSDLTSQFPNTFPSETQFEVEARKLGINQDSLIVIYDRKGIYSSPRAWWLFRAFGHENVAVLDGGLPAWIKKGNDIHPDYALNKKTGNFKAKFQKEMICESDYVLENLNNKSLLIMDARSKGRFDGSVAEPRQGIKSGHIPNSINLPYGTLLDDGKMLSFELLRSKFDTMENKETQLVFSCGSGVTACILALGAEIVGFEKISVFDGSWSEWGSREGMPVDKKNEQSH